MINPKMHIEFISEDNFPFRIDDFISFKISRSWNYKFPVGASPCPGTLYTYAACYASFSIFIGHLTLERWGTVLNNRTYIL